MVAVEPRLVKNVLSDETWPFYKYNIDLRQNNNLFLKLFVGNLNENTV